jgi:putative ABC transport system permease protein
MIKTSFIQSFKNFIKGNKRFLFGLLILFGASLFATFCIIEIFRFEHFHVNRDRILRISMIYNSGDTKNEALGTSNKIGPELKNNLTDVESFVRLLKADYTIKVGSIEYIEDKFYYADSTIFDIFSFRLILGDSGSALNAPNQVVLSESTAKKYFPNEDPLGNIVTIPDLKDFYVTGIVEDAPSGSQIQYNLIASFSSLNASKHEDWWSAKYLTYLLIKDHSQLDEFLENSQGLLEVINKQLGMKEDNYFSVKFNSLTSSQIQSSLTGLQPNINYIYILCLAGVVSIILIIILFRKVSYPSMKVQTLWEFYPGKTYGLLRDRLLWSYLGETLLIIIFFAFITFVVAEIIMPLMAPYLNMQLVVESWLYNRAILLVSVLAFIIRFVAIYPDIVMKAAHSRQVL